MRLLVFICISVLLVIHSCSDDAFEPAVDMGYDYYPVKSGNYIVYQVDSIDYNQFTGSVDTFVFQIKEVFGNSFYDNSNRKSFELSRFYRKNQGDSWQFVSMGYVTAGSGHVERVDENIRFIPMIFPTRIGLKWNGNAMNTYEPLDYMYSDVDIPYAIGQHSFDSCAFVLQQDEASLISRDYAREIFARHIGMIYRKVIHLVKDVNGLTKSGVDYSYKLIDYGNE